jgi:hypothetical protein
MEKYTYIPGVCNIGPDEIKKRMIAGWSGLVIAILYWGAFIIFTIPKEWALLIFLPVMMSAVGFLQAHMHFCVYFGFANLFNFGDVGKTDSVSQAEYRKKDRKKAWQIVSYAILVSLVTTFVAYNSIL